MPRTVRFLCFLLVCTWPVLAAERPVSRPGVLLLNHETALQMALAKNFAIQVERFEPQIAQQRVRSALGDFDPTFSAEWGRRENTIRDVFQDSRFHLSQSSVATRDAWRTGFGGLTPWGLRYDLGIGTRDVASSRIFDNDLESRASIEITQPLLRGFGTAANMSAVRIARTAAASSEWAFRQRVIDILTETDAAYNDLHSSKERLKVAERSRDLALRLVADNESRLKIGVKSPLDVTEAQAAAASRKSDVILAQSAVRDFENLLKQLVTSDLEPMLDIQIEIETPPSPAFLENVRGGIREALAMRPDYRQAVLELETRNITLAFRRNDALPTLDLTGSLAMLGFDDDQGTALSRTAKRDASEWTVGAIFSIPLPNRQARGAEEASRLQVAQQLVALQRLEQQIVVSVDQANRRVTTARELIYSTDEARRLAQETADAGEERLKAGVLTTFELLELQRKLAVAEAEEIAAKATYNKAVVEYYQSTGITLQKFNIKVE